jgi:type I restriction enzyme S subunit
MSNKVAAKTMKQDGEQELKPKLRFPEFRDAGAWEKTKLGELLLASPSYGANAPAVPYSKQLPTYLRITDISDEGDFIQKSKVSVNIDAEVDSYLEEGDIVLARTGASVGKSYRYKKGDGKLVFAGFLIRIKPDPAKVNSTLLCNFFSTRPYWSWVRATSTRSGQPGINSNEYASLPVVLPRRNGEKGLREQRQIAECLTSLDELISAHGRKLDALKAHKKGLMQQLFPCEGETLPLLRFPEFRNSPKWEEKNLEKLAQRGSGHTPSKTNPAYYNGGIKWVSLADSKRLDCGLISETEIKLSEQGVENSSAVLHREGSVLVSRDAGVGKSAIMNSPMAVSQHFIVWNCDSRQLSNWFLYYLLQTMKPLFERVASGSTIKTIGLQFFIDLRVTVPLLPEQQRIASCLSALDDLIAAQTQKLEAIKTHKKGLMQQLFPSMEEVEA